MLPAPHPSSFLLERASGQGGLSAMLITLYDQLLRSKCWIIFQVGYQILLKKKNKRTRPLTTHPSVRFLVAVMKGEGGASLTPGCGARGGHTADCGTHILVMFLHRHSGCNA